MANYTKLTDFASKDALPTGSPAKIVKGTEIDDELQAIETAVATKADNNSPALTGTPTAPTAANGTNTTQIATTAFVQDNLSNIDLTPYAPLASPTFTGTVNGGDAVQLGSWKIWDSGGTLYFQYNGNNVFKIDSSGNMTAEGNVTAYGSV